MSWLKEALVRKVVEYQVPLFNKRFPQIGSLYCKAELEALLSALPPSTIRPDSKGSAFLAQYCLGKIVSVPFFYHKNWRLDVYRGPYTYARDWLAARLQIAAADFGNQPIYSDGKEKASCGYSEDDAHEQIVDPDEARIPIELDDGVSQVHTTMGVTDNNEQSDDTNSDKKCENDRDDLEVDPRALRTAASTRSRIQRLINLLPEIFPRGGTEECMLFHHDLLGNSILVDQNHENSGIIDWNCIHTVPLWLGCQIPKFLHSREVKERPLFRTEFEDEADENHYWRLIEEHEKTQLQAFFLDEMQRVCPEWMQIHQAGSLEADFDLAVNTVALPAGATDHFERWLGQVEQGAEPLNLRSAMNQY